MLHTMVPAAQCVPTNQLLIAPMAPVINTIVGAMGGVFFGIVIGMLVLMGVLALVTILNKSSARYMKNMAMAAGIPIGLILLLIAYNAVVVGLNNVC
jgi:hypothetical protein